MAANQMDNGQAKGGTHTCAKDLVHVAECLKGTCLLWVNLNSSLGRDAGMLNVLSSHPNLVTLQNTL